MVKNYPRKQRSQNCCVGEGRAGFEMTGEWIKEHLGQATHA